MKRILLLFLLVVALPTFAQKEHPGKSINYNGEYNGTFADRKNNTGTIQLFLNQTIDNNTDGLVIIQKKRGDSTTLVTGTIMIRKANQMYFSGNFTPSELRSDFNPLSSTLPAVLAVDSYQCRWALYGTMSTDNGLTIMGKAVPINCPESNVIDFKLTKKDQCFGL
ncbi:MAG: hypothetical protein WC341_10765 [Bacteroidales bacterium]|jgi:hypothetical protein